HHEHGHDCSCHHSAGSLENQNILGKIEQILDITQHELFEIGRFLVIGAMIAATMQTFIPQSVLLGISKGPVLSVLVMIALAVILSICSTVDAFVALGFINIFSTGSILAFLVFGPMVDIKSVLMFSGVFKPRAIVYMVLIPLLLTILISISINILQAG
ncbi:MAG: permease, partial [Anaerolineaceae bacterium]|nr:permease [Anaerolineaceae bacterium]